ncbi:serine/threonine-protein kinase fhke-related [Anaeramoeba flamelloides]|uniref:Serine/threonine-protein kinase fhke-related n=1 Tax=Anaeramoeba flamelloides TaxID=1746091 RepID=A0ABQ8YJE7_9EUKA|nr:serine/threonine-protein kinase fhke-related [Anaeramoeba flamelloides]
MSSSKSKPKSKSNSNSDEEELKNWGILISKSRNIDDFLITTNTIKIGRNKSSHFQITKSSKISGTHCIIHRENPETINKNSKQKKVALAFLEDTSTNGTFVNGVLVGKGNIRELNYCDEITFVSAIEPHTKLPPVILYFRYLNFIDKISKNFIKEKFKVVDELGKGEYGIVYLVLDKKDNDLYALKYTNTEKFQNNFKSKKYCIQRSFNEVNSLIKFEHDNIIKLYEVFMVEEKYLYLKLEYVKGGNLSERIKLKTHYPEDEAKIVIKQILEVLLYMHEKGFVHRDIKPENVLMVSSSDTDIKLTDFGFSRAFSKKESMYTRLGTENYVAPEIITERGYTNACDLWSTGVVLLFGYLPFSKEQKATMSVWKQILLCDLEFPSTENINISPQAKDLIQKLIEKNPLKRLTAQQALNHPWITGEK